MAKKIDLQKVREQQDLSRTDLAERTGISTGYIKLVERRKARPSPDTIRKLTKALGVPYNELVFKSYRPGEPFVPLDKVVPRKTFKRRRSKASNSAQPAAPSDAPDQQALSDARNLFQAMEIVRTKVLPVLKDYFERPNS